MIVHQYPSATLSPLEKPFHCQYSRLEEVFFSYSQMCMLSNSSYIGKEEKIDLFQNLNHTDGFKAIEM